MTAEQPAGRIVRLRPWPGNLLLASSVGEMQRGVERLNRDLPLPLVFDPEDYEGTEKNTFAVASILHDSHGAAPTLTVIVHPGQQLIKLVNTAAHEAAHMCDFLFESIGEDAPPGSEARAYLTGMLCEEIVRFALGEPAG